MCSSDLLALDTVARLVGMPGKVGVEGKDIGPMIHAGRLADVQAYCLTDVIQTAAIFLRLELVRGVLPLDASCVTELDFYSDAHAVAAVLGSLDLRPGDRILVRLASDNDGLRVTARSRGDNPVRWDGVTSAVSDTVAACGGQVALIGDRLEIGFPP